MQKNETHCEPVSYMSRSGIIDSGNLALFAALAEITRRHNGLWSAEAEHYLLTNAKRIR
jgi:hypothetical protein